MEGIGEGVAEVSGWGDIVGESADWDALSAHLKLLPVAEEVDEEVASEFL